MLRCKSATLTPDGGINTVWEDNKDPTKKYEIYIPPKTAEAYVDYSNWAEENNEEQESVSSSDA